MMRPIRLVGSGSGDSRLLGQLDSPKPFLWFYVSAHTEAERTGKSLRRLGFHEVARPREWWMLWMKRF
jgi:hypothetical protein